MDFISWQTGRLTLIVIDVAAAMAGIRWLGP